ncbi:MAG: hypothetical protein ACRD1G_20785 [Acidimicrobiales bacterium]
MSEMNAEGCLIRLYNGGTVTLGIGDRVLLSNDWTGTVGKWTRKGVAVWLDLDSSCTVDGMRILCVDCGDDDIGAVLAKVANSRPGG